MSKFDEWADEEIRLLDFSYDIEESLHIGAEAGWKALEGKLIAVIEELENYPTSVSLYLKSEHAKIATEIKEEFIKILRESLL